MIKVIRITFIFCLCMTAWGQIATTTSLVGTVTDNTGAVLPDAAVSAVNQENKETYNAVTNAEGYFSVPFIRVGSYNVTVTHPGFQTAKKTGIIIDLNQTARADFAMQVGQVTESVTVAADAPPIATDDASLSEVITQRTTAELPLNGRDALQLAITVPGVIPGRKATSGNPGGGEDFIGAGTREIQNSISLDGISIVNNLITTTTFRPSVSAVQEFQVQTGTYSAQYGAYMGVHVNMITKSGGNSLHGAVWEYLRNDALDARNFFEKPGSPKAPLRQNQFGFELAGPVWIPKVYNGKNKTFFMIDYEGLRQKQVVSQLDTVLTPLMRQGNFSELLASPKPVNIKVPGQGGATYPGNIIQPSQLSPLAQNVLQYMPLPNLPGISNNYLASFPNNNTTNQTIGRVDENLGDRIRLFFRYAWQNTELLNGNTNPNNGYNQPVQDRNFVIGYTQTITPNMVNDVRFGRQHTNIDSLNFFNTPALANAGSKLGIPGFTSDVTLNNPGIPEFDVGGFMTIGGQNSASSNWFQKDTTWQGADVFSWTHGAHAISAGVEFRKLITGRQAINSPRGLFNFTGAITGSGAADLVLGLPSQVITPGIQAQALVAEWRDGFYVLDNWQVNRKLTLNLGLRYELPTVPYSVNGYANELNPQQTQLIPANVPQQIPLINPNHKDFAPRIGVAYRLTPDTVIRAGFGLYYNPNQTNTFTLLTTNPPFAGLVSTFNSPQNNPTLSLANPTPSGSAANLLPSVVTPNPNLPTAYQNQWSLDIERGLWKNAALDVQYLGSHSLHLDRSFFNNTPLPGPGQVDPRRPNQLFRSIRTIQNDVIANYEALNVVVRQRMSHGLSMLLSYTWSHTLDVASDSNNGGQTMNPYNWRADYGNANWDIRHRFVASYIYEIPFLKSSKQPLVKYALANWQINGITIIQSGLPFNVTIPTDTANIGINGIQRPNLIGTPQSNCGGSVLTNCITASSFALPTQYTFGNAGRNLLHGPGTVNTDLSLFKNIPIRESVKAQLRFEAFNVFNTPQFNNPQAVFGTPQFGSITSTSHDNRQIQVAAQITF
jgi:Carboxypeptidase regulatory-like domain/TonB dependent receptor